MTTVLVVDDSRVEQRLAGGLLSEVGITPVYAGNGREALEMIARSAPDLVLTDLQMPEIDGLELVQEARLRFPRVPIVLMTAFGSEETAVAALKAGAASYVPKRNLASDLTSTVQVVLGVARVRREQAQVLDSLEETQSRFCLSNDGTQLQPLIEHLQRELRDVDFCPEGELIRVGTALYEALHNAIEHGNLELSSESREAPGEHLRLINERRGSAPWCERKVRLCSRLTRDRATYIVEDDGAGFDVASLPDPTDAANLEKTSGRGLLLIRVFMDDVSFNESGNQITMVKCRSTE